MAERIQLSGDLFAAADDRIIRMRAVGATFRQIAEEIGMATPTNAMRRYREARARQIESEHLPRPHSKPSDMTIAWAAGFFDGEGCVFGYDGIQRGYRRFTFGLLVSQVAPEPLDELHHGWGGSVRCAASGNPRHQDQWRWSVRGHEAAVFLEDILPYLRVKRAAAETALPWLFRIHGRGIPFTEADVAARREAVSILRDLNSGKGRLGKGAAA
jgi:hypothetical protein